MDKAKNFGRPLRGYRTSITYCTTFKILHILKIYKTLLSHILSGSSEKEEDNLHEQEKDVFDDDEVDTITVLGQDYQNSLL